jgi:hypothetical protein
MVTGEVSIVGQMSPIASYRVANIVMSTTNELYGMGGVETPGLTTSYVHHIDKSTGVATVICNGTYVLIPDLNFVLGFDSSDNLYFRTNYTDFYLININTCAITYIGATFSSLYYGTVFNNIIYITNGPGGVPFSVFLYTTTLGGVFTGGVVMDIFYTDYGAPGALFPYIESNNATGLWTTWTNTWPGPSTQYFGKINLGTGIVDQRVNRTINEYIYGVTAPCWYQQLPMKKKDLVARSTHFADFFMTTQRLLFRYNPNTFTATPVGTLDASVINIVIAPTDLLYGIVLRTPQQGFIIYRIDATNAQLTHQCTNTEVSIVQTNAMIGFSSDNTLWVKTNSTTVHQVNVNTCVIEYTQQTIRACDTATIHINTLFCLSDDNVFFTMNLTFPYEQTVLGPLSETFLAFYEKEMFVMCNDDRSSDNLEIFYQSTTFNFKNIDPTTLHVASNNVTFPFSKADIYSWSVTTSLYC